MTPPNYDQWRLDTGEKTSPLVAYCICGCNEEIYHGQVVWTTVDGYVLVSHFYDYAIKEFKAKQVYAEG
jgi:hypothetical protein